MDEDINDRDCDLLKSIADIGTTAVNTSEATNIMRAISLKIFFELLVYPSAGNHNADITTPDKLPLFSCAASSLFPNRRWKVIHFTVQDTSKFSQIFQTGRTLPFCDRGKTGGSISMTFATHSLIARDLNVFSTEAKQNWILFLLQLMGEYSFVITISPRTLSIFSETRAPDIKEKSSG